MAAMTPEEFFNIMANAPEPTPVFFRLYYDPTTGKPISYSMEDLPGTYITIDADAYHRSSMRIRIRDGKIVPLALSGLPKLKPGTGTPCHPCDVAIVVSQHQPNTQWSLRSDQTD